LENLLDFILALIDSLTNVHFNIILKKLIRLPRWHQERPTKISQRPFIDCQYALSSTRTNAYPNYRPIFKLQSISRLQNILRTWGLDQHI